MAANDFKQFFFPVQYDGRTLFIYCDYRLSIDYRRVVAIALFVDNTRVHQHVAYNIDSARAWPAGRRH